MKRNLNLEIAMLALCGLFLFGSLLLSSLSGDGVYFVFGYPISVFFLVAAHWLKGAA